MGFVFFFVFASFFVSGFVFFVRIFSNSFFCNVFFSRCFFFFLQWVSMSLCFFFLSNEFLRFCFLQAVLFFFAGGLGFLFQGFCFLSVLCLSSFGVLCVFSQGILCFLLGGERFFFCQSFFLYWFSFQRVFF